MNYKSMLKNHIKNDNDFYNLWKNQRGKFIDFDKLCDITIDYIYSNNTIKESIFIDKKYLDISWLQFNNSNKIINLDFIYEIFKDTLQNYTIKEVD